MDGIEIFSIVAVKTETSHLHAQNPDGIIKFLIPDPRTKICHLHAQTSVKTFSYKQNQNGKAIITGTVVGGSANFPVTRDIT
ncbi:Hypothetical predicted protein [Mytilus galloprovincialis]|uniref:Uncharacterized protein n=1 Tax=Mytilus galloprovincialis TaxID=29158 RepID=A0A8B6G8Q5_MYTGA|nr:Hypothetical predicted protein [Mytilus galloprovincialis]